MDTVKSHGVCIFCNKEFSKGSISRHLGTHLSKKAADGQPGKSFHVKVESDSRHGSGPYFLNLWIDGNATFGDLDRFLRMIWLECCGHMSAFTNPNPKQQRRSGMWTMFEAQDLLMKGKQKEYENFMEDEKGEIPKSKKIKDGLAKDLKLKYDYDFGSTTKLQITVIDQYPVSVKEEIVLLSRNEPLEIMCEVCGSQPATQICTICIGEGEDTFCDPCAEKHAEKCSDFADYAAGVIVNSPRMGVCAYDGGSIDTERDGTYVKK